MSDSSTQPKDPRLVAAEIALAEANARKAVAEASASEVSALLPDLPKEVTAGSLKVPEAPAPIATVAAYRALSEVGKKIAEKLPQTGPVWIVPDGGFRTAIDTHELVARQLDRLTRLAEDAVREAAAVPTPTADTEPPIEERSLGVALGLEIAAAAVPLLMSLFATSRTMTTAEVTVGFTAAAAVVGAAVDATRRPEVYVWGITPPPIADVETLVTKLQHARDNLEKALVDAGGASATTPAEAGATAEAEAWKAALVDLVKPDATKATEIVKKISDAAERAARERNRSAQHGRVLTSCGQLLKTIDEVLQVVTGADMAAQFALGAALKQAHVLVLQPTYTGAESTYEDVKLKRDRALHMGSTVIAWHLLDKDKRLVNAGIQSEHASATTKVGQPEVTWGQG